MDISRLYGPGYAGYLHGVEQVQQRNDQALKGLGLLSNMQTDQARIGMLQQQFAAKQEQERIAQERYAATDAQFRGLLSQPDEVVQGSLGMPRAQAEALYAAGGPDAFAKVLQENAKQSEAMRLIGMLPPEQRPAAIRSKTGIAPSFHTLDTGGAQTGYTFDPVNNQVSQVFAAQKTPSPGSIPFEMSDLSPDAARQFSITKARAGAAQAPSLTINSPLIPGKEASNKIDAGILDTGAQLSGMSSIEAAYKPEYQTLGTKYDALKTGWKEKLGLGVKPEDKRLLADFSQYKVNAANALNSYIKAMTGAAMSEPEAERIMKGIPVAGNGLFDGDSPTEFKSKMDQTMGNLRMVMARFSFMKRQGFALGQVPLEQMPQIMRKRRDEIRAEVGDKPDEVKRRLAQEFGLVYEN